jgi:hypothetical protein
MKYPLELLVKVFEIQNTQILSSSLVEEYLSNIWDYLRANNLNVDDIDLENLSREKIKELRFPVLSKINKSIEDKIENFQLPQKIKITWDQTLEKSDFVFHITVENGGELRELINKLIQTDTEKLFELI